MGEAEGRGREAGQGTADGLGAGRAVGQRHGGRPPPLRADACKRCFRTRGGGHGRPRSRSADPRTRRRRATGAGTPPATWDPLRKGVGTRRCACAADHSLDKSDREGRSAQPLRDRSPLACERAPRPPLAVRPSSPVSPRPAGYSRRRSIGPRIPVVRSGSVAAHGVQAMPPDRVGGQAVVGRDGRGSGRGPPRLRRAETRRQNGSAARSIRHHFHRPVSARCGPGRDDLVPWRIPPARVDDAPRLARTEQLEIRAQRSRDAAADDRLPGTGRARPGRDETRPLDRLGSRPQ